MNSTSNLIKTNEKQNSLNNYYVRLILDTTITNLIIIIQFHSNLYQSMCKLRTTVTYTEPPSPTAAVPATRPLALVVAMMHKTSKHPTLSFMITDREKFYSKRTVVMYCTDGFR